MEIFNAIRTNPAKAAEGIQKLTESNHEIIRHLDENNVVFLSGVNTEILRFQQYVQRLVRDHTTLVKKRNIRVPPRVIKVIKEYAKSVDDIYDITQNKTWDAKHPAIQDLTTFIRYMDNTFQVTRGNRGRNGTRDAFAKESTIATAYYVSTISKMYVAILTRDGNYKKLIDAFPKTIGSEEFHGSNKMFKNSNRYIQLYDISKGDQYYQQPIVKVPSEKIQPRDITKEERIAIRDQWLNITSLHTHTELYCMDEPSSMFVHDPFIYEVSLGLQKPTD